MKKVIKSISVFLISGIVVAAGVTPSSAVAIKGGKGSTSSVLSTLVANGVITQSQADVIKRANKPLKKQWKDARKAALTTLVADGTITSSQAKKVLKFGKKVRLNALVKRVGLTNDQATLVSTAIRVSNTSGLNSRLNIINDLVVQGVLTDAQAQAYIDAVVAKRA